MGLNISLYTVKPPLRAHLTWDTARFAGDREFATLDIEWDSAALTPGDVDYYLRPRDFAAARAAVRARTWPNGPTRYLHLLDIFEREPEWWVYFGW